jgi:ribosomal protein S11
MTLSNKIFERLATKLKLETTQLEEKIFYAQLLKNQVLALKKLKKNNTYRQLSDFNQPLEAQQNFLIKYTIAIIFSKANTTINLSDTKGNVKLFYNAGSVNLQGKQRRHRKVAYNRLINLLIKNTRLLNKIPVAVHLKNVKAHKKLIIAKLKHFFFVKAIRSFNQTPYNGCRKRKLRRKKYVKKTKR